MAILKEELVELQSRGMFNIDNMIKDAMPTFTAPNIGVPSGFLDNLQKQAVFNIVNKRTADLALGGRKKMIDWAENKQYIPIIERTGQTTPYSDFGMPLASGANFNFNEVGHYRFSVSYQTGNLVSAQFSKLNMDYQAIVMSGATEALAIELNRTAFNGYIENSSQVFTCYGLLNNPELPRYEAANKTFDKMTWKEIVAFFAGAIAKLTAQTGNNINGDSNIRCVLAAKSYAILKSVFTDLGISVLQELKNNYPNMDFVPAIEFDNAYNGQNVIYFIGEDEAGGIPQTADLGYSELALFSDIELAYYSKSQAISAGTIGAIIYKLLYIVRYNNI